MLPGEARVGAVRGRAAGLGEFHATACLAADHRREPGGKFPVARVLALEFLDVGIGFGRPLAQLPEEISSSFG